MEYVEIKPCPFCGKRADVRYAGCTNGKDRYRVRCYTLNCYGSAYDNAYSSFASMEEAIEAWNRRKGMD